MNKETSYELWIVNGLWNFALDGVGGGWTGVNTVAAVSDQWQHIAVVRPASTNTVYVYFNGVLSDTKSADTAGTGNILNSALPFQIGSRSSSNGSGFSTYFKGEIDEVRLFNTARTSLEIQSDMNNYGPVNSTGLVAYFDMNDFSGSTLVNKSTSAARGPDLTAYSSPASVSTSIESATVTGTTKISRFLRTYLSATGWKVPSGVTSVKALVVGGGGAAGFNSGGGGSGGGVLETTISNFGSRLLPIVGAGGDANVGGVYPFDSRAIGAASSIGGITAGGGNSGYNWKNPDYNPAPGGASVNGYGAGGTSANSSTVGTAGDTGFPSSITGTLTYYGGGGGGGAWLNSKAGGAGGLGGGGAGVLNGNGTSGSVNTGGGGGSNASSGTTAGDGGSGIIILSYSAYSGEITGIANATYRTSQQIVITVSIAGNVTFYAQGKAIPGCVKIPTVSSSTITATCNWKPSQRGTVNISARIFPISSPGQSSTVNSVASLVGSRSGKR